MKRRPLCVFPTSQRVRLFISINPMGNPRIWKTILYCIICHCIGASSHGLSDFLLLHKRKQNCRVYLIWTRCLKNKQDIIESLISCLFFSMKKKLLEWVWRHCLLILELILGPTTRWSRRIPAATTNNKLCRIDQHYFKYNVLTVYFNVYNSHIYAINLYFNSRWFISSNRVERFFIHAKQL